MSLVFPNSRVASQLKTAYFMTSGKLGFWPTYPTLVETKKNYDNLVGIFDLPPLQNLRQISETIGPQYTSFTKYLPKLNDKWAK